MVGFALACVRSLLDSWSAASGGAATGYDTHVPAVAAVVHDDLTGAHFEVVEGV
jgi:hypothetical protein